MNGLSPVGKLINVNKTKSLVSDVIDILYIIQAAYILYKQREYILS